eukprot:11524891-Heterocapsa_arctica.AAC.1
MTATTRTTRRPSPRPTFGTLKMPCTGPSAPTVSSPGRRTPCADYAPGPPNEPRRSRTRSRLRWC